MSKSEILPKEVLSKIDGYLEASLIPDMKKYMETLLEEKQSVVFGYHTDNGGVPCQAILDILLSETYKDSSLSKMFITFERTEQFYETIEQHNPEMIWFSDFEPHEDFFEKYGDKKIIIAGHHPGRSDVKEITQKNKNIIYLNPVHHLPDSIEYSKFEKGAAKYTRGVYTRGVPIIYPLSEAALKLADAGSKDTIKFIQNFGLRAYGYGPLADLIAEKNGFEARTPKSTGIGEIIDATNILYARLPSQRDGEPIDANFNCVMNHLKQSVNFDGEIRKLTGICSVKTLYQARYGIYGYSRRHAKIFGSNDANKSAIVFPINLAPNGNPLFEQIGPILTFIEFGKGAKRKYGTRIYVDTTERKGDGSHRKLSIRNGHDDKMEIDFPELLKSAYKTLELEKNYGGHTNSCGAVVEKEYSKKLILEILKEISVMRKGFEFKEAAYREMLDSMPL